MPIRNRRTTAMVDLVCITPDRRFARSQVLAWMLATLAISCTANAQLAIDDLGLLPGAQGNLYPTLSGISADGKVLVGSMENRAFRWDGAMHELQGAKKATAANADGSVVVGTLAASPHAFRWTAAGGLQDLGTLPGSVASDATGVSGDGTVVVGTAETSTVPIAWIWDAGAGMRNLGSLGGPDAGARAYAVSRDGRIVVGVSDGHAFRWTAETGMVDISPKLDDLAVATAYAISADGTTIVGAYNPNPGGVHVHPIQFRWTTPTGFELLTDQSDRSTFGSALATDGTGSHIFGYYFYMLTNPTMWSKQTGTIDLQAYMQSEGLDLAGWQLNDATAASDNGDVVAGTGYRTINGKAIPTTWRVSGLTTVGPVFESGFEDTE